MLFNLLSKRLILKANFLAKIIPNSIIFYYS